MSGKFYAVGGNGSTGKVGVSTDGINWTVTSPASTDVTPSGFGYSPALKLFVHGGLAATPKYSADPASGWSDAGSDPITGTIRMVSWAPELNLFIAGGEDPRIASSADGNTWTSRSTGMSGAPRGAVWVSSIPLWVVPCSFGSTNNYATSPDGITWTTRTIASVTLNCVTYSASRGTFAMGGRNGTPAGLWSSTDGTAWTSRTATALGSNHVRAIARSDTLDVFVAGGEAGNVGYSSDGITWTAATSTFGGTAVRGMAWSEPLGLFVAVGDGGKLATSPDGINWTSRTSGFSTTNILAVIWVDDVGGVKVRGFLIHY